MLTTLKDIFRPNRRKVSWTFLVGVPLTAIGMFFGVVSVHGADFFAYAGSVLLLPVFLLSKFMIYFGLNFEGARLLLPPLQLLYYYVLVSIVEFIRSRGREIQR